MSTDNAGEGRNGYTAAELAHLDDTAREFMGAMFGPRTPPAEPDAGDADGLTEAERAGIHEAVIGRIPEPYGTRTAYVAAQVARIKREAEQRGAEKAVERIAQAIDAKRLTLSIPEQQIDWERAQSAAYGHAARIARADATRSR